MREKQALAQLEKEAAERQKEAAEREERAHRGRMELLAAEEKIHQMQQETARLKRQVKKAMEEQQKLYPLESPVYNNVGTGCSTVSALASLHSLCLLLKRKP
ncbi:unnamed protein product [Natator depressus]